MWRTQLPSNFFSRFVILSTKSIGDPVNNSFVHSNNPFTLQNKSTSRFFKNSSDKLSSSSASSAISMVVSKNLN